MSDHALLRFEWIVRGLAQDAAVQRTLFPAFAGAGEELALEFDEHHRALAELGIRLPADAEVAALDAQLAAMSALDRDELWFDDEVLATAPEWATVRELARRVLDALGWSHEPPPAERDLYVGPP